MKNSPEYEWLNDVPSQIPQQAIQNLDRAFDAFFKKRSGFPKFKKKHGSAQSFRIPQNIKVKDGKVFVPKLGYVKMIQSRGIEGTIKGATFRAERLSGGGFKRRNAEKRDADNTILSRNHISRDNQQW